MPPNGSRISLLPGMWIEKNLDFKLRHPLFTADIGPLLAPGYSWDIADAAQTVSSRLIALLPGEP
jgi:hypothetical protein